MLYARLASFLSIISITLLLLLCIGPAINYGSISQSSIIAIHLTALFIFFLFLIHESINKESPLINTGILKPLFALLVIIAVSSFTSIYFFNTQLELHKIITFLIIFIAVATFFRSERRLHLLIYWIICSTALIGLMGIGKHLNNFHFDGMWPQAEFASFVSKDSFHAYASMGLCLSLALLFCNIRAYSKILLGGISFVLIGSLMLSSDKGGWLGLIVLSFFIFIFLQNEGMLKGKFWFIILFFTLFLWMAALFVGFEKLTERFMSVFILSPKDAFNIDYDTTLWNRIAIWKSSLKAILEHPFSGVGLGNFKLAYPAFRDMTTRNLVRYAHQEYLQFAVETGILGLLSLMWLGLSFFKKVIANVKFKPGSSLTGLKVGALSGCFTMIFRGLYEFNFHIPSNAVLFVILCGVLMALQMIHNKTKSESKAVGVRLAYLAGSAVIILYMAYMGRLLVADENYTKGIATMDNLSFAGAERHFKKALLYIPHNADYHARLGELYAHRSRFKIDQTLYEKRSIDSYKKALSINPYNGNLHIETAINYVRYDRQKDALVELKKAVSLDPNNVFYRTLLAKFAVKCGDLKTAEEEFKKALLIKSH